MGDHQEILAKCQQRWCQSCELAGIAPTPDSEATFRLLAKAYSEPHRQYHTLYHIEAMFQHLDEHAPWTSYEAARASARPGDEEDEATTSTSGEGHLQQLSQLAEATRGRQLEAAAAIHFAVWFHDAVYDASAKPGVNEEASASLAKLCLRGLDVSSGMIGRVMALISATTKHELPRELPSLLPTPAPSPLKLGAAPSLRRMGVEEPQQRLDDSDILFMCSDASSFLDADLSILAAPWPQYLGYAQAIRLEYSHLPDSVFMEGRIRVLQSFLARPRLFLSISACVALEDTARNNLAMEVQLLQQNLAVSGTGVAAVAQQEAVAESAMHMADSQQQQQQLADAANNADAGAAPRQEAADGVDEDLR